MRLFELGNGFLTTPAQPFTSWKSHSHPHLLLLKPPEQRKGIFAITFLLEVRTLICRESCPNVFLKAAHINVCTCQLGRPPTTATTSTTKNNGILDERSPRSPSSVNRQVVASEKLCALEFYGGSQCRAARGRHGWRRHVPRGGIIGRTDAGWPIPLGRVGAV